MVERLRFVHGQRFEPSDAMGNAVGICGHATLCHRGEKESFLSQYGQ